MLFLRLNLVGTLSGLIIIYVGTSIPFSVFFLTGFFGSLPSELEDAAMIDGCTEAQAFWKVMFPIAQPAIITLVIFNFIGLWNDYLWALIFVNTDQRRTLMLGVEAIMRAMRYTGNWAGMFAGIIILFLPTFVLFVLLSEKIISGITAGAVKT
jgi:N-acetylglucosamine transport system permease protein